MKTLITALLLSLATTSIAQDRIPERDWDEQRANQGRRIEGGFTLHNMLIDHPELRPQRRCPPQRVIVIERYIERPAVRYGWVIIGWDYQPTTGGFTPRKMWLPMY